MKLLALIQELAFAMNALLQAELDNGQSIVALRRFSDNLAKLPENSWGRFVSLLIIWTTCFQIKAMTHVQATAACCHLLLDDRNHSFSAMQVALLALRCACLARRVEAQTSDA